MNVVISLQPWSCFISEDCMSAGLYLVPLLKFRERFAAFSFCLSASSSWESLCFSSSERACPALTKASGVCKKSRAQKQNCLRSIYAVLSRGIFSLTWSLNMREIISNTCILHCCSLWADARNLIKSSKPLMWMAQSSLSWTLASSSTFCRWDRDYESSVIEIKG